MPIPREVDAPKKSLMEDLTGMTEKGLDDVISNISMIETHMFGPEPSACEELVSGSGLLYIRNLMDHKLTIIHNKLHRIMNEF